MFYKKFDNDRNISKITEVFNELHYNLYYRIKLCSAILTISHLCFLFEIKIIAGSFYNKS